MKGGGGHTASAVPCSEHLSCDYCLRRRRALRVSRDVIVQAGLTCPGREGTRLGVPVERPVTMVSKGTTMSRSAIAGEPWRTGRQCRRSWCDQRAAYRLSLGRRPVSKAKVVVCASGLFAIDLPDVLVVLRSLSHWSICGIVDNVRGRRRPARAQGRPDT